MSSAEGILLEPGFSRRHPLRTVPAKDLMTAGQRFAPRVEMVIGRDGWSAGITITAYLVEEDGRARPRVLFAHRWQDVPQSIEECLTVAYRGLSAYFEEAGIVTA